jgi:hypothetical protein
MSSGDSGPGLAADERLRALEDRLTTAENERRELREQVGTLAGLVHLLLPPLPPGELVPPALADALAGPRSPVPVHVPLCAHGRDLDVWVTGGAGADPAAVWASILGAVPREPGGGGARLAPLAEGVAAIVDGRRYTVSTAAGCERGALWAALRHPGDDGTARLGG